MDITSTKTSDFRDARGIRAYDVRLKPKAADLVENRSVFVIDDDSSMCMSIKRLLGAHGIGVLLFDSTEALFAHDKFDNAICLVIDINLAGQSGIDLRRYLTQEGITAPVIYVTGNDSATNRSAAIESGCIAYLTKPFTARSLIDSIGRARFGAA